MSATPRGTASSWERFRRSALGGAVAWAVVCGACTGTIDEGASGPGSGPGGGGGGGSGDGVESSSGSLSCSEPQAAASQLQRLTPHQYEQTVEDLLGIDTSVADGFPRGDDTHGYEVGDTVSPLLAEKFFDAAELLAEQAVADLGALLPCDPAGIGEDACASEFIEQFVRRAYRRPATTEELERFESLYRSGRTEYGFDTGIRLVVQAALSSPEFLYHLESTPEGASVGEVVPADDFTIANRLSYFLWSSMPDEELLAAAEAGALRTPAAIEAQARRMLDHPRSHEAFRNFYRQWLQVDGLQRVERDSERFPEFDQALARQMDASLEQYIDEVVWEGDGRLETLLLGDFAYVNGPLASVFGVEGVEGEELQRVRFADGDVPRVGLLSQPALLTKLGKPDQTDPIHRGQFVREQLFCQTLPPPPNDVDFEIPEIEDGVSTRERFRQHSEDPACAGCHKLIDPIGFGFEHFDAIGRYREADEGGPIDASGEIFQTEDADGPFDGVPELAERLASSEAVRDCVARQVFRFALRRTERDVDSCTVEHLETRFAESGGDFRELLVAVTTSDAFRHRRVME